MPVPEFTVVVGVDRKHLRQLYSVMQTWKKHKPSLWKRPWIVFYDRLQLTSQTVKSLVGRRDELSIIPWPAVDVEHRRTDETRFGHPQRYKMLAGFVHVPAMVAATPYWLKLDTDVVAVGDDDWIDPNWFAKQPAIVAHRWSFTKPADQMLVLDEWVQQYKRHVPLLSNNPPLCLTPQAGSERLGHNRIISWCGFFSTAITRFASNVAETFCGEGQLPVASQDGYLWYISKRLQHEVVRTNMKQAGWEHWSTDRNVERAVRESLYGRSSSSS